MHRRSSDLASDAEHAALAFMEPDKRLSLSGVYKSRLCSKPSQGRILPLRILCLVALQIQLATMSLLGQSPIMAPRQLRVVCIGAGFAGLMLAHRVKQHDFIDLCIYEKNAGIGGTWFENKYPGAACDVRSS